MPSPPANPELAPPGSPGPPGSPASPPVAEDRHFNTDHLGHDLKGRSVRGGAVTVAGQAANFVLRLGSTAVLARLLTPGDFGLIAMVTAVTGFVAMFKDAGLSMATVQRPHITHAQVSTLFWLNLALSAAIMALVAALAPAVAWFYGEPRLTWITLAIAGTFIFGGLAVQHQALLRRQMRFTALTIATLAAAAVGTAAGIIAAVLGAGYWALVIQNAVGAATVAAGMWIASGWLPGRPRRHTGVRPMLAFGANLSGAQFLNYWSRNFDNVLLGWAWGINSLGLYTKAYGLLMLPIIQINGPASAVALPALSRLQDQPERFKRFYFQAIGFITAVGMPIVVFLFVQADNVILLVLGPKFAESTLIFQALGLAAFLGTFNVATGWIYTALNKTHRQLRWQAISVPFTILGFFVGLPWGAFGVAIAVSISQLILRVFGVIYCYHGTFIRPPELLRAMARPAITSVAAAALLVTLIRLAGLEGAPPASFFAWAVCYAFLYSFFWAITPGGRRQLARFKNDIQSLRANPKNPNSI